MKTQSLITMIGALAGVALLTTSGLQAGTSYGKGKAPLPPAEMPMDNLLDPIETTVSTGYDTSYFFRGSNFGQEAIWTGVDMSLPLALPVGNFVASWGAWYINPTDPAQNTRGIVPFGNIGGILDDELDIYASLGTTIGAFDVTFGWTHYSYLDSSGSGVATPAGAGVAAALGDRDEIGITIGTTVDTPILPIDLSASYFYDFDIGDPNYLQNSSLGLLTLAGVVPNPAFNGNALSELEHYFEGRIGTSLDLTDRIALALGVTGGWYSSTFSHIEYRASLPVQIAENVVLEPYVAYLDERSAGNVHDIIRPGGPLAPTDDDIFAGVSLSVSF